MIAIVVSRADEASTHIAEQLRGLASWQTRTDESRADADGGGTVYRHGDFELRTFDDLHIYLETPARAFDDPDLVVFASRHSGETGPLLTAHFTGNFGPAEYGGDPGTLARACPNAHANVLDSLAAHAPAGYEVSAECTHHGPTDADVPSMFVEVGSDESAWRDPEAAAAVARAILDLDGVAPERPRQLVGFGGGHYVPRFSRILAETDWAVGHVGADWQLSAMGDPSANRAVVSQTFERSGATLAVVDGDHPELESVVGDLGYRVVSETWVRETTGVPLGVVDAVESALGSVDDGVRFGADAATTEFEVVRLPGELLAELQGIDASATLDAVAAHTVAYETEHGGTRVTGRAAVADGSAGDALFDALVPLLREKYDTVERADGVVEARQVAFDPVKARELGVPEGPAFGRLAAGEAVEVDGRPVSPESVRSERVERFALSPADDTLRG